MRTTAILGVILMGIGIGSLAYFASPVRLMFQSPMSLPAISLLPPALGALSPHLRYRSRLRHTAEGE